MPRGRLFVVAGPSGAGKGTLIEELLRRHPTAWLSVSATTRAPRSGETHGVQYYFLDRATFRDKVRNGDFLEWAEVHGNLYGTPRQSVVEHLEGGRDVILEIDVQGARQVREKMPDSVGIFVMPPSLEELERRLRGRGTESDSEIARRLRNAREESKAAEEYRYVVVNDDLRRAREELCAIYVNESPLVKADR
ncbi:MAG: guanylate kinase [Actinobacteria bacterium]|nr:guanylate kinase [Actinomycetota bacterium]